MKTPRALSMLLLLGSGPSSFAQYPLAWSDVRAFRRGIQAWRRMSDQFQRLPECAGS